MKNLKILAFDTCLDKMYVSFGDENKVFSSKVIETTQEHYHSAYLISTITNILKDAGFTPQDVDVIATNVGPGSFTGIRACTTVARVMAQAGDMKTVGVSSLEILSKINTTDKKTLVALDARKEMAYVAIFEDGKEIFAPKAILLEELKEIIKENDYFIVTDDKLEAIIGGVSYQKGQHSLGEFLLAISANKLRDSDFNSSWKNLLPLYIQPPALHVKPNK